MFKVHVAFGFHVNLYHSFREDTNDQKGFASDIRIIRHIIDTMDEFNQQGVPVKGTWDFENAFSLEESLPAYAPDIIENVKRRVQKSNDEIILMGYNNGAMGAMTPEELDAAVNWAITNQQNSGVKDIFGTFAPVLRPQEMMFSPSQTKTYRQLGIEALSLYYSAIPFDGFRTLIPLLPEEHAFNPLNFSYKDDEITIIPTYNTGDLIDFGSLREQVKKLHKQQKKGKIKSDVLIFINMDADSEHWYGLDYPAPLNKLPNMTGIKGYIEEVMDLSYVVFDTPGNYLKTHPPLKDITFNHDIADGNFDGYASWSEKPFNRQIWSRLERARTLPIKEGMEEEAFKLRMRLLSTTHFGLSTPHLNINREKKALELSAKMLACIDETKLPVNKWHSGFLEKTYFEKPVRYCLPDEFIPQSYGGLRRRTYFVDPWISYKGEIYRYRGEMQRISQRMGRQYIFGTSTYFELVLPESIKNGYLLMNAFEVEGMSAFFHHLDIQYPYTEENAYVHNEIAALQRAQDDGWEEVAPLEIAHKITNDMRTIIKRNYEGDVVEYELKSFEIADPENKELDSFNHQVTNGIVGIRDEKGGFLIAVQKNISNSMAFCPMRIHENYLYLNPFGTYHGHQRHHATHGNGLGAQAAVYAAPQFASLAPAYNGAKEELVLAIFTFRNRNFAEILEHAIDFVEGSILPEDLSKDFSKPRPPQKVSEALEFKKLTTDIPFDLQRQIFISGMASRIKGGFRIGKSKKIHTKI